DRAGCDRGLCMERGGCSRKRARAGRLLSKPRARRYGRWAAHLHPTHAGGADLLGIYASDAGPLGARRWDGHRIMGACPPEQTTTLQLIQSFVLYARAHRTELQGNAVVAVLRALREAYPCRAEHG